MVIYWPPGLLSKNNLMSDLSFPLKLDINAVYLTVDDKVKLDISSYFHTNDIRILTPFLLLVYFKAINNSSDPFLFYRTKMFYFLMRDMYTATYKLCSVN